MGKSLLSEAGFFFLFSFSFRLKSRDYPGSVTYALSVREGAQPGEDARYLEFQTVLEGDLAHLFGFQGAQ
jgi:hypothetical protein